MKNRPILGMLFALACMSMIVLPSTATAVTHTKHITSVDWAGGHPVVTHQVKVWTTAPLDSDQDGIANADDPCPQEPYSESGCPPAPPPTSAPTRNAPVLPATPATSSDTQAYVPSSSASGGAFAAIRACESGGNYATDTGNGFYGAYQFTQSTWDSVAPSGYAGTNPASAPPSVQDQAAATLYAQSGSSPWPVCGQ